LLLLLLPQSANVVNEAGGKKKRYNCQLSETNSRRQLVQGDDTSLCATPSPTPSVNVLATSTRDDVMPSAAANHEPVCADVMATSLPQQVVVMTTREPRQSAEKAADQHTSDA